MLFLTFLFSWSTVSAYKEFVRAFGYICIFHWNIPHFSKDSERSSELLKALRCTQTMRYDFDLTRQTTGVFENLNMPFIVLKFLLLCFKHPWGVLTGKFHIQNEKHAWKVCQKIISSCAPYINNQARWFVWFKITCDQATGLQGLFWEIECHKNFPKSPKIFRNFNILKNLGN